MDEIVEVVSGWKAIDLTGFVLLGPAIFCRFCQLNLRKLAMILNTLAQWCTSWCHQPRACVQTQGINRRGIMRLLDDVVLDVQALRKELLQEVAARSFFAGAES